MEISVNSSTANPCKWLIVGENGGNEKFSVWCLGAQERTRTSTVLPPLGPEPSASTNSATWAQVRAVNSNEINKFVNA